MGCSLEAYRVAVGLFVGILQNILTKKASIAAKRVKGLRVHGLAARFAVTTLLLMLLMAGVEPNPGPPPLPTGEETHVSSVFDNVVDSGHSNNGTNSGNGIDNNSDSNTQQQFDRLFSAINHLARTVSHLGDKVGHFEQLQNETAARIDQRLSVMESTINTRLSDVEETQNVLRLDMDALDQICAEMKDSSTELQNKVDDLEAKVEYLETQTRRNSLLFFGIPRVFGESWDSCEAKVREIIRHDMRIRETVLIERAQRVGSAILVQFQSFKQRQEVLSHSRELRAVDSPVYVREDFSETVRRKRAGLTPLLNQMRDDGRRAKLRHDKLITDDGTFTFDLKRQQYQKMEPRGRPAATRRYHNVGGHGTADNPDFHRGNGVDSFPRPLDRHHHHTTDSYRRVDNNDKRSDRQHHSNDDRYPRPDSYLSRPSAQHTTSGSSDREQGPRQDSYPGLHKQHHTSDNGFPRRLRGQQYNSNYSDHKRRDTQNDTPGVNKQPGESPADHNNTGQHADTQQAARATPGRGSSRPRGSGRGRRLSSVSPGYTSPGNSCDVRDRGSPMEGIPHSRSADAAESSAGNTDQLTNNEAFTDAPDSDSARSIRSRLSRFAYSGTTRDPADNWQ